jgi:murein DD-endopeptidase MepM/ murein hydrolase activator NlpD
MAERAGALAHWAAARSPWQESWLARWRTWIRRPQLLRYLIITDSALAASIVVILTVSAPVMQAAAPLPPLQARAILARGEARWRPAAALPLASATPLPTRTPSPTPEPLLTATPIPAAFSQWESWLPLHGGWNGAAECWGAVLAPMGTGHFTWPTDKHYLVGKDYNWRWHPGLDLGGEVGDPIYAADAGVVVYAGWNAYGFGNLVILDHGNGQHSLYGHLSEIHVTCGQGVPQGAILGLAGSTGYSTGPHLHFEIRSGGSNVNPWDYLP